VKFRIKPITEGRDLCAGILFSDKPISLLGDVNVEDGVIKGLGIIEGKILLVPAVVGSTVGSYILYALSKRYKAPSAVIVSSIDPVLIAGVIIGGIPLYKLLDSWENVVKVFKDMRSNYKEGCIIGGEYLVIKY